MGPLYDRLIKLYARNPVADIRANKENVYTAAFPDAETLITTDNKFKNWQGEMNRMSEILEGKLYKKEMLSLAQEVHESLKYMTNLVIFDYRGLDKLSFEARFTIVKDLIREHYYDSWKTQPALLDHFDLQFKNLLAPKYFFVSYTNRDAPKINKMYKTLIDEVVSTYGLDYPINAEESKKRNLLMLSVVRLLTEIGGVPAELIFYDRDDMTIGDNVKNEVMSAVTASHQFLQLVSDRVFLYSASNWTFMEYMQFAKRPPKKREYFVLAGGEAPAFDYPEYAEWHARATDKTVYKKLPNNLEEFEEVVMDIAKSMKKFLFEDLLVPPAGLGNGQ
jgi:hypothetical protein